MVGLGAVEVIEAEVVAFSLDTSSWSFVLNFCFTILKVRRDVSITNEIYQPTCIHPSQ